MYSERSAWPPAKTEFSVRFSALDLRTPPSSPEASPLTSRPRRPRRRRKIADARTAAGAIKQRKLAAEAVQHHLGRIAVQATRTKTRKPTTDNSSIKNAGRLRVCRCFLVLIYATAVMSLAWYPWNVLRLVPLFKSPSQRPRIRDTGTEDPIFLGVSLTSR